MGLILNIKPGIINNYDFKLDSAWLAGFINADRCFAIINTYALTLLIGQIIAGILYYIKEKLNCGNVYYDKRGDTYVYAITDIKGMKIILVYLSKFKLKTNKYFDYIKFFKLVEYK
jgi:LAGLIDADG endonuclease